MKPKCKVRRILILDQGISKLILGPPSILKALVFVHPRVSNLGSQAPTTLLTNFSSEEDVDEYLKEAISIHFLQKLDPNVSEVVLVDNNAISSYSFNIGIHPVGQCSKSEIM